MKRLSAELLIVVVVIFSAVATCSCQEIEYYEKTAPGKWNTHTVSYGSLGTPHTSSYGSLGTRMSWRPKRNLWGSHGSTGSYGSAGSYGSSGSYMSSGSYGHQHYRTRRVLFPRLWGYGSSGR